MKQLNFIEVDKFDWSLYDNGWKGGSGLQVNPKIKAEPGDKVYCHEKYAKDLYKLYCKSSFLDIKKDLQMGDNVMVTNLTPLEGSHVLVELQGGLTVTLDLKREKKIIQIFGYNTINDFICALKMPEYKATILAQNITAYILEGGSYPKISLWQGYVKNMRMEFMQQIAEPNTAYIAKIVSANRGGYFVQINGVDAFMPGSLAAPNKIIDFQSMVDKEVIVMIEDYLSDIDSIIVSHKKYIDFILPKKLEEIDYNKLYNGTITGTSKFGIFVEFENFFTGLLHVSKMSDNTLTLFQSRKFEPCDNISFWIDEITKDNRIVLTEESPENKLNKLKEFMTKTGDDVITCQMVEANAKGIYVSVNDITGLVPMKEIRRANILIRNIMAGDKFTVICDKISKDNILLFKLNL